MKSKRDRFSVSTYRNKNQETSVVLVLPIEAAVRLTEYTDSTFARTVFRALEEVISRWEVAGDA